MSKITILGDTSGKIELVAANTISPNIAFTLPSADGSAGQVLATDGAGTLSFVTNDGTASFQAANSAGAYANAAFIAANTPSSVANAANSTAQSVYDTANTLFDGTADLVLDTIVANTVTSVNVISSNEITANNITIANNFVVSNVAIQWHTPPLTSKGSVGDKAGWIAVDDDKIYRCTTDYTDGNADIWVYVNFTGGTWG